MHAAEEGKLQVVLREDSFNHEFELCALACVHSLAKCTFYSKPSATSTVDMRKKLLGTIS